MTVTRQQLLEDINNILEECCGAPRSKKSFRVSIGHGKKSYVKKDASKCSGIKGNYGLGLLEESAAASNTKFKALLDSAKPGDKLEFKVQIEIEKLWVINVFTPGKRYVATIRSDNQVSVTTDLGRKVKTKKEMADPLFAYGSICTTLDCEQSYATIASARSKLCTLFGTCTDATKLKITPDTPLTPGQKSVIATKLTNKYLPKANTGFVDKVIYAVGGQKLIKTIEDIIEFFIKYQKCLEWPALSLVVFKKQ